jgi:5-methyltetrahydropteroyltriglutamate--homocysteine methyltransferase
MDTTVLGYPRIGGRRELKRATEAFWAGKLDPDGPAEAGAMARGTDGIAPLELTKWFATNHHYLVPEPGPGTALRLAGDKPVREYREARALGIETRPVLLGPLSFLLLAKPTEPGFDPLILLDLLLDGYVELLRALHDAGALWVQLDEPVLAADRSPADLEAAGIRIIQVDEPALRNLVAAARQVRQTVAGP